MCSSSKLRKIGASASKTWDFRKDIVEKGRFEKLDAVPESGREHYLRALLMMTRGNRVKAAQIAGVKFSTFARILGKYEGSVQFARDLHAAKRAERKRKK
jgi:hypothetical protein